MPLRSPQAPIALVHFTSPPILGGVEAVLGRHARLLAERGGDVRVITGRGGPLGGRVRVRRVPLLDSRHPRVLAVTQQLAEGRVTPAFAALSAQVQDGLERALAGASVCVVHNALTLHKNLALTAALHRIAARRPPVRFVAWCHDLAWTNPQYREDLHPGQPWRLLTTPLPGATYVTVSRDRQRALSAALRVSASLIEVIPNGIDPAAFLRLSPAGRWLAETLRLWDQQVVLLLPVRITRRKQIEYALRVTQELVRRELSVRLLITGPLGAHNPRNRDYLDELRALRAALGLEEQVVFCGDVPGPGGTAIAVTDRVVADLYALADALLLPSREEGFGLPLLETGLTRVPAFVSDIPPFREIGGDAVHTFGLDDSPAVCAQRILHGLMDDRGYRLRRRVLGTYTWDVIMRDRIVPLLTQLTAAAKPT
ncbi:MAG TPA: glycosyltransferase family 4 protein [bacterium]|nr:glycosyltransferase family 4 protein [bacterium]